MAVLATDTAMPLPDLGFSPAAISKSPANVRLAATKVSFFLSPQSASSRLSDAFSFFWAKMGF